MIKIRKQFLHILSSFFIIISVVSIGVFAMFSIIHTALKNSKSSNTLYSNIRNSFCSDKINEPSLSQYDRIIVLRLDDVQSYAWSDISMRMILDAYNYNAPIVAGIIPKTIGEDIELSNFLKRQKCNIEIAIHGWDHYGKSSNSSGLEFISEFGTINYNDSKERIQNAIKVVKKYNGNKTPTTFIPPYNLISDDARRAIKDFGIPIVSSIGANRYDYHTTTYNFDNKRVIPLRDIIGDCEKTFLSSPVCVIMIHPQDYTDKEKKLDERLYREYYIGLLDALQKMHVKFATFEQLQKAKL